MFLESLIESSGQARSRRGWATLTSFLIETATIGLLILVPLLYTEALPNVLHWTRPISVPMAEAPKAPPSNYTGRIHDPGPVSDGIIRVPTNYPPHPYVPAEPEEPPGAGIASVCTGLCVPGGIPNTNAADPALARLLQPSAVTPKAPPPPAPTPVQSQIIEGMLIRRVQPVYPRPAIIARIQGTVVLKAIIGRDGAIREIEVLGGHPMLVGAAVDAVRQWRYRPYYLGGHPVEVETQITVNFRLGNQQLVVSSW